MNKLTESGVNEEYLGDGVYVVFDGYNISLDLRGQDQTTQIVMEPRVVDALMRFIERNSDE